MERQIPSNLPTEIFASTGFLPWLAKEQISLAFTTYQTNMLMLLGVNPDGTVAGFERIFDRAMGLYATSDRLYLSSKYQIWQLDNVLELGQLYNGYDRLYVPRFGYTTGDLDVHDIAIDRNGRLIFISTLLNCLATVSDRHSCKPLWKPSFISQIINEDRCHLNGLAMVNGEPRYVTACSRSDVVDGWRDRRADGGCAIDVQTNEIICTGLSMPHSPRWYQDRLWLNNSGTGEFGYVNLQTGKFEPVAFCPGFLRGLAFVGNYAIVGLSKPRGGDKTFSGLALDRNLAAKDAEPRCGLMVIDINTGVIVHWVRLEGLVTELYDVQAIPNAQRPMSLGFKTDEIAQLITLEPIADGGNTLSLLDSSATPEHPPTVTMSTLGTNGRFGNQIFQYAFLKIYAQRYNLCVETPAWVGQYLFGDRDVLLSRQLPVVSENETLATAMLSTTAEVCKNVDFWGYFQFHTQYYAPHKEYFRSLFKPLPEIEAKLKAGCDRLRQRGKTIVGIHLRRGDYGYRHYFLAPNDWYKEWLKTIWKTLEEPVLFIASDDLENAIADFADYHPVTGKDLGLSLPEAEFYPDFYLLIQCDVVAISNSSFSFAACLLNETAKLFYRPHLPSQKLIPFTPWDSEVLLPHPVSLWAAENLSGTRRNVAEQWLNLTEEQLSAAYAGELGKAHLNLLSTNIKYQPLTAAEKTFVERVVGQLIQHPKRIQYLLVAMLYYFPHQLPSEWYQPVAIPAWLVNDYLAFMLAPPEFLQALGEADDYAKYIQGWFNFLHSNIVAHPESESWQSVALFFSQANNALQLYFNDINLKEIYVKRAEILEIALKIQGLNLDYEFPERPDNRKKIRLGILNAHFSWQTETLTTLPIFEYLNRQEFEIILYGIYTKDDALEKYCHSRCDRFVKLPGNLADAVHIVRNDDLDILLIGTNLTAVSNPFTWLAMHRMARVQVASVSSPVTTGIRHIDYYISGRFTEPPQAAQKQYSEKLITLEGSAHCFSYDVIPSSEIIANFSRENWGITNETSVFISGANFYKIIPEVREAWAKILAAVPNSILVLYPFAASWNTAYPTIPFLNQFEKILAKYGVDKKRLVVLDALPSRADVKACLQLADVYLDSFPYTGANSTVDPLEVGLPTVVMAGNSMRSRQAAALLQELQITDLIAHSEAEYINLAIALAHNSALRQQYRQQIASKMASCPKFLQSRDYSAQMGKVFQQLFQTWQSQVQKIPVNSLQAQGFGLENKQKKTRKQLLKMGGKEEYTPHSAEDYFNQSQQLRQQQKLAEAEVCLRQAIKLKPDFWGAYNNLGTLLQEQGKLDEAIICYQKTIDLNPNFGLVYSNLASIWQLRDELEKAKTGLLRCLELNPTQVEAHINLANIFKQQRQYEPAVFHYQKVIELQPDYAEAYLQLGFVFEYQDRGEEALVCYQTAYQLTSDPNQILSFFNFINYLRLKLCDWQDYDQRCEEFNRLLASSLDDEKSTISPLTLSAFPIPLSLHRHCAELVGKGVVASMAETKKCLNFQHPKTTPNKLRIGYISPDFRDHAVGRLIHQVFPNHNRSQFEIYGYSTVKDVDDMTHLIRQGCDVFVDLADLSPEQQARRIYADGIHILIDLAGYTIGNATRTLALQPAPIQAQFLGYPDTMGAEFIQYAIVDRWLVTPEIAASYTEQPIYLPQAFVASALPISQRQMTREEFGLPPEAFVFCCFNTHYKINPEVFDVWMRILNQIPGSVLWLGNNLERAMNNLRQAAVKRGVDPSRLIFAPKLPQAEYLARYHLADLYLDTFIYNAGSTAAAVLWAGLPLLTKPGNTNASRMGASICAAAGLESTICDTAAAYEERAVYLATHPEALATLRRHLADNRDRLPLFDVAGFARHLESAYWQMWAGYQSDRVRLH